MQLPSEEVSIRLAKKGYLDMEIHQGLDLNSEIIRLKKKKRRF